MNSDIADGRADPAAAARVTETHFQVCQRAEKAEKRAAILAEALRHAEEAAA